MMDSLDSLEMYFNDKEKGLPFSLFNFLMFSVINFLSGNSRQGNDQNNYLRISNYSTYYST